MQRTIRAFVLTLITALSFAGCNEKLKGGFTVNVDYKNADQMIPQHYGGNAGDSVAVVGPVHILLEEIPLGGDGHPIVLDSVLLTGKQGKITLKGSGKEEGIYQLQVEQGPII